MRMMMMLLLLTKVPTYTTPYLKMKVLNDNNSNNLSSALALVAKKLPTATFHFVTKQHYNLLPLQR
eukprot:5173057-Ditylum_brightwellii.AAC.1